MAEAPAALLAGGHAFALPADAEVVEAAPLRPAPLAGPGMLGIAVVAGQVVPVMAAAPGLPGGPAWVLLDGPNGRVVVAGEAFAEIQPQGANHGAPMLVPPRLAARRVPPALPAGPGGWSVPMRGAAVRQLALAAELGGLRLVLPFALLERVLPMPVLRPAPAAGAAALGYAVAAGAPVLVLDPAWLLQADRPVAAAGLLVLFRHGGRRLGLPCDRIGPARPGEATLLPRLEAAAEELVVAPLAEASAPPPPEPSRALLLCAAGGQAFALPVEEVVAVIPPIAPSPAPGLAEHPIHGFRGVTAHRGDVLPVLDGGLRLGATEVLGRHAAEAPLLRLAGAPPVALAVSHVTGLRRIPERLIAAVAGEGLVSAVVAMAEAPLPVCRAAVLGALK
ncbi:chemotaxis protein CheW [Falsiroseomonas tokyonensis]|uniref:Chemotaxis protein CheW n=1 Tax=Falsiroseomonas tokyonensis TaxID=430521 RepID=A0ABV7BQS9_9PROT|nr:chemotaxis protein CheW [Falsiroseomonas tokyonensis]MBU8538002.1 chemotaxis protein CheW [Falsiroseomonas tokyonensis]